MGVQIRRATAEDYEALCRLFDEVDALHRDHLPELFRKPDGPVREPAYFLGLVADESVGLFVAEAGDRLVGFVCAAIKNAPPVPIFVPRCFAVVDTLGVTADFQRQGIGRMLMDAVEGWAVAEGADSIELNVHEFNQGAIAFYEELGYETASRRMSKPLGST